ncbi:LOW QUALITY PROTEIN: putative ATP-dependent RNA helicase DDX60 [Dama dama]
MAQEADESTVAWRPSGRGGVLCLPTDSGRTVHSTCLGQASLTTPPAPFSSQIEKFGFPSDLTLSPREMVQLYDTMFEFWKSCLSAQELCPEEFIHFKNNRKMDARKNEESLKAELASWVKNGHTNEIIFTHVLVDLGAVARRAERVKKFLEQKPERRRPPRADKEAHDIANKLRKVKKSVEKYKTVSRCTFQALLKAFVKWRTKNPRRRNQSLLHEAEHDNLLKVLEKNLDIPQDCTYADQKATGAEVSPGGTVLGAVTPHSSYCCSIWAGLGVVPQGPPLQSRAPWAHPLAAPEPTGLAELV